MDIKTKKVINIKTKENYQKEDSNEKENNYATEKVTNTINSISNRCIKEYNKIGKEKFIETNELIKEKLLSKEKENIKLNAVKEQVLKAKKKSKSFSEDIKRAIKLIVKAIKELTDFIIASSWIIIVFIIVISMIAFIMTSVIGIFFSNEFDENQTSLRLVMQELNNEFIQRLTTIQNENPHDEFEILGSRAEWKDIISVFIVKYSNGDYQTELISLDEKKIKTFKDIFWSMNEIAYSTEEITEEREEVDSKGKIKKIIETKTILHIQINGKNLDDIKHELSNKQLAMLNDIQKDDYVELWEQLLINTSRRNSNIVEVAKSQIGEVGGEPYWSWYGFSSRVSWCACFVSWCANECGYIDSGIIPKFSACENEGITWFKTCNLWQDNSYIPKSGDIIFFDWECDGHSDHVGIVEKIENNIIYTIEGNTTGDVVKEEKYNIGTSVIKGYGTPNY